MADLLAIVVPNFLKCEDTGILCIGSRITAVVFS